MRRGPAVAVCSWLPTLGQSLVMGPLRVELGVSVLHVLNERLVVVVAAVKAHATRRHGVGATAHALHHGVQPVFVQQLLPVLFVAKLGGSRHTGLVTNGAGPLVGVYDPLLRSVDRSSKSNCKQRYESSHPFLPGAVCRSEEHTSELQSRGHLVCRLLLEKKNRKRTELSNYK